MLNLREFRLNPDRLSDLLPWAALVSESVVLNKDGSLLSVIRFRGPDLDSATEAELVVTTARLNNVLRRLGSGWAIYSEARRRLSQSYPESVFDDPISFLIDNERRARFSEEDHFESDYFLTLVFLPQSDTISRIGGLFVETARPKGTNYEKVLESFQSEIERVLHLLLGVFQEAELLIDGALLSYLHSTVSTKLHPIELPEMPIYLDSLFVDSPLTTGFTPRLGDLHLRVVSVKGFPGKSQPGLLDALNRLGFSFRWVTRFICLDKEDARRELSTIKKKWFAKRKGVVTLLKEVIIGSESIMADSDAVNMAEDADEALQELQEDAVSFGYYTASVVLFSEAEERVEVAAREVEKVINSLGFSSRIEDVNAVDAWLGTIPGNCRNNVRRPILNTINLAHLMPLSAVWAGPEENQHLEAPPLFYALTNGSTPFRFVTHVGDVGHILILGPTGSGKSVLLNLIEAQFLRYPEAQVYVFDKGGSSRVLTAGVGGEFYNIAAESSPLTFQPLAHIDEHDERTWAHEWLLELLGQENVPITPTIKAELWTALTSLASADRAERTLFGLSVILQNDLLRAALQPYTINGPHGRLLDSVGDNLCYSRWQVFEMELLMESPSVLRPVLSYLFHRLEKRFTGQPTLLVLDEAWLFLDHPGFAQKIREWLKVLRKANVSVVFATQSLSDIEESEIASTIKEACFTKIYLPNAGALTDDAKEFYRKFGLNDRQIQILAYSTPKRHYFYCSPHGSRLFDLTLGPVAMSYIAATGREEQAAVKELLQISSSSFDFNRRYLELRGHKDELRYLISTDGTRAAGSEGL